MANILESGYDQEANYYVRESQSIKRLDDIAPIYQYLSTSKSYDLNYPHTSGGSGFVLLIAFRKVNSNPFSYPIDMPMHSIKSQEILNFFMEKNTSLHKVAIFGTKNAAQIAYNFMLLNNIAVKCFVDDFAKGNINGIPIISYKEFVNDYQKDCDYLVKGPSQRGDIENREGLRIKVLTMQHSWFL